MTIAGRLGYASAIVAADRTSFAKISHRAGNILDLQTSRCKQMSGSLPHPHIRSRQLVGHDRLPPRWRHSKRCLEVSIEVAVVCKSCHRRRCVAGNYALERLDGHAAGTCDLVGRVSTEAHQPADCAANLSPVGLSAYGLQPILFTASTSTGSASRRTASGPP